MSTRPQHAYFEGRVIPYREARVPIDDRGLVFSESLYEVVPVTAGRARWLTAHVERLMGAAVELGLAEGVPPLSEWERFVADLLRSDGTTEGLLYAQLTGGSAPREHVPRLAPPPVFFAYVTPYRFPRANEVERGITAITLPDQRWARRDWKTTMLLPAVLAKKEAQKRGADEALLVEGGLVNEGASSNVFAVVDGVLLTPAQSENLLPGTMRPLVVELARAAGVVVEQASLSVDQLRRAEELFITSSSQLVMPVLRLDGVDVGSGRAGPLARGLARALREHVELE